MKISAIAITVASTCLACSSYADALDNASNYQNENNSENTSASASTEIITVIGAPLRSQKSESITPQTNIDADFGDQLSTLPGLSIARNGPVTALIQYRGLFGDRVGISVDGVNIVGAGPNAMDSPLSHVLPEPGLVATLYRGIVPVSAGVQTLGGQVNIASPADALFSIDDGFQGNISASAMGPGSAQQYQGNAFYATQDSFFSGTFMHQQRTDRDSGNGKPIPNSNYQRNGGKFRIGHESGQHQFDASYQWLNTNESGTPALAMDITFIDAAWYRLGYRYNADASTYLTINVFGNSNQHIMDNFSQRPLMMANMARQNTTDAVAQGLDATVFTPWKNGELRLGVNLHKGRNNSVISNPNNAMFFIDNFSSSTRSTTSTFAEWDYSSNAVSSLIGLRYSRVNMDANAAASSLSMMNDAVASLVQNFNNGPRDKTYHMVDAAASVFFHANNNTDIVLGASQKNRAPTFFERFTWLPLGITGGLADGFNYLGNLELEHETARQFEVGIDYTTASWQISPRLFYQDIENYIAGTPSSNMAANMFSSMMSGRAPFIWSNTDAVIKGADVTVNGQLSDTVSLKSVLSIQHGNRDDIDDALFRIAPERLLTTIDWQTAAFTTPMTVSITSELVGRQSHTSSLQNEESTPGYGLLHLSTQWQLHRNIQVTAQINNLFDKFYAPHTAGVNRVMQSDVALGDKVPNLGREWQISISYQY